MATKTCPHCGGTGVPIAWKLTQQQRLKKGLTLKEVSIKMGISIQYLSDLEHGRRNWDAELFDAFNKALS